MLERLRKACAPCLHPPTTELPFLQEIAMSNRDTKHARHDAKLATTSVSNVSTAVPAAAIDLGRRRILGVTAAGSTLAMLGAPSLVRAQSGPKIRIGYWPVAAGLP